MLLSFGFLAWSLQAKPPLLMNGGFENGLSGWKVEGTARVVEKALQLGPGTGAVRQRYDVPGLRILWFGATVKLSGPKVQAHIRLQCFDKKGHVVMDLTGAPDAKSQAGIYLKTQATTAYVVLSVEKTSADGTATVTDVKLTDDDKDRVEHKPRLDLDAAMKPFWKADLSWNESVLLLSSGGSEASGRLLFKPSKILSVRDASLAKEYIEGKDFKVEGNTLVALKSSAIPTMQDSEFAKGQYPWTELQGRHIFVTYRHGDQWAGPVPNYQGDLLPTTMEKLRSKKPVTIVAFGDSITLGINVSGFRNVPPYMPPWPSLVARELGNRYSNSHIKLINTALGGMTSQWAKDNAHDAVATLHPDLVLLAFGMNDFWSLTPDLFAKNIADTMAVIRSVNPWCEFLLVGSMKFDPAYTTEEPYVGNLAGYPAALRKLVGPGVGLVNMTEMSEALYRAKSQRDLATDPMHPDDFFARVYAQCMVAALVK